jgi:hypothetical protein
VEELVKKKLEKVVKYKLLMGMKTKLLFGLLISAIVLLSFSFSKNESKEKLPVATNQISPINQSPIGGLAIEDNF